MSPRSRGEQVQALVIGGGVLGCAVARHLAIDGIDCTLVEVAADVGEGASRANSGIIHTGFDAQPGTLEADMLRRSAEIWPGLLDELSVPWLPVGALMLARDADERQRIRDEAAPVARSLGVRVELVDGQELRDLAPYVSGDAIAAMLVPDEAVVDPFWLTRAYAEAAQANGARIVLGRRVVGMTVGRDEVAVRLDDGSTLRASQVFDCAGLYADEVAALAGDASFRISARKGQFLVSEELFGVDRIVLPIPGPKGKGLLVTPIVFGGVLLGPTAQDMPVKGDRSTEPGASARIVAECSALVPAISDSVAIRAFAGIRTVSSTGAYIIRPSTATDRLYLVAGVRSTGISASPAIAEAAVTEAMRIRGWSRRRPSASVAPMRFEEGPPGDVVCPCRSVSRGEVEAACRTPIAPITLDGVKRAEAVLASVTARATSAISRWLASWPTLVASP